MEFIFGLIVLALDIWAIVNVIGSAASTGAKIAVGAVDHHLAGRRVHHLVFRRPALEHPHGLAHERRSGGGPRPGSRIAASGACRGRHRQAHARHTPGMDRSQAIC